MAATGATIFSANFSQILPREATSTSGHLKWQRISNRSLGASTELSATSAAASAETKTVPLRSRAESSNGSLKSDYGGESISMKEVNTGKSLKDYFEEAKVMIRSDGGPPRWFSPFECGSHALDSPLLLYLPGIDGVGLGLVKQHQKLGQMFDIWCLHIPVQDRTSFTGLVKLVEGVVRSERNCVPDRPIYLVGESIGACIALAVSARNPDIDLVLSLANPATSFSKSRLQLLQPVLELMPEQILLNLPFMLKFIEGFLSTPQISLSGDPLRMLVDLLLKGFPQQQQVGNPSEDLASLSPYFSVAADILPKKTLLWKLEMLKVASAYANSRLHAVKAQALVLSSGRDQLFPSQEEGERLRRALPNCQTRSFDDSGHLLFLEDDVDLVTVIKAASFYRRGKNHDYIRDYIPPTPSEFNKIYESYRWIYLAADPVLLSTLEDGTILRSLKGIPSEGPVLYVGYHMLLGLELGPLALQFMLERNILLRGIAHPMMFVKLKEGKLPELSLYDNFRLMGAVPVSATNFYKLLSSKAHVVLYPGGMREALHRKGEEYKLFWPERSEFVRMAARFGAKIVPFGVVGEDDLGQVVIDYDDLKKLPYFKDDIEALTNEGVKLREDASGEVANQPVHLPGILPKVPGRFYYYFGKPIDTKGRKQELRDKEKCHELYLEVKSEVEKCIAYLKEKRETDPYRNILPRLIYQANHGFTSEVPTFDP